MDKIQIPAKIRYEYQEDEKVSMQYAHGVWGGINTQGEIEINFYTEQDKIPLCSERYLTPDGGYGPELAFAEDDTRTVVRKIHSKVILNKHTANAFLTWLAQKIDALEAEEIRNCETEYTNNNREQ